MDIERPLTTPAPEPGRRSRSSCENQTWLLTIGMIVLTINLIIVISRSINDPWTVMFIIMAFANVLPLYCMRSMEKTPEIKRPVMMRAAAWALASMLPVLFTYRIAIMLPLFLAVIIWLMACGIIFGGSWLTTLGVIFLTTNSIIAVYFSINDVWTVMFVVTAYANVVLVEYYMRSMETMPEMKLSVRMKASIWALTSTLTVLLTYRITIMMPLFLAVIVWLMACVIVLGGFYALVVRLVYREEPDGAARV